MATKLRFLYRAYRYRYRVDPAELRFVRDCLRPGQVAVDVGCHKGAYAFWMRRQVGPSGTVFAFEPQPRQVAYLRDLFGAMAYENVVLVPMALSDRTGRLPLHVPGGNGRTHGARLERVGRAPPTTTSSHTSVGSAHPAIIDVDVTTLDAFFAKQPRGPDFLKIDVEGHELAVLAGGCQTLERYRPALLVECESRHRPDGDVRAVFDFLHSLGYRGSFCHKGRRRPLDEFDPAVHQRIDRQSPRLPRDYVNNFAFEHGRGSRV
jgi:FkbM family methyltransferase